METWLECLPMDLHECDLASARASEQVNFGNHHGVVDLGLLPPGGQCTDIRSILHMPRGKLMCSYVYNTSDEPGIRQEGSMQDCCHENIWLCLTTWSWLGLRRNPKIQWTGSLRKGCDANARRQDWGIQDAAEKHKLHPDPLVQQASFSLCITNSWDS